MTGPRTVVIGAGIAGLVAARRLAADREVVVLDKGRGVGGRVATRRVDGASFDHGAQFLTARTDWFTSLVDEAVSAGVLREWFRGAVGSDGPRGDGHSRWCGIDGMNSFAKYLARDLDIRTSTQVAAVAAHGDGWVISTESGALHTDEIVLTAPVPQALGLLEAGGTKFDARDEAALRAVEYEPCTAVLVRLRAPLGDGPRSFADGPLAWAADNREKGASVHPALTLHSSAAFSSSSWDLPDEEIAATLVAASGLDPQAVDGAPQVHRWRFARPIRVHEADHLRLASLPPAVLAGDGFGGGLIEGAALSGWAAAAAMGASSQPNS